MRWADCKLSEVGRVSLRKKLANCMLSKVGGVCEMKKQANCKLSKWEEFSRGRTTNSKLSKVGRNFKGKKMQWDYRAE
jgi:hypothetical protein